MPIHTGSVFLLVQSRVNSTVNLGTSFGTANTQVAGLGIKSSYCFRPSWPFYKIGPAASCSYSTWVSSTLIVLIRFSQLSWQYGNCPAQEQSGCTKVLRGILGPRKCWCGGRGLQWGLRHRLSHAWTSPWKRSSQEDAYWVSRCRKSNRLLKLSRSL